MDISESSHAAESSSDEDSPPFTQTSRAPKRARPSTSRGRGLGRGRRAPRGRSAGNVGLEDSARVHEIRTQRINFERELLQSLSHQDALEVLQEVLERNPGVLLDIMHRSGPAARDPHTDNQPTWCVCSHCKDMPTDIEKKCCQQSPVLCVSLAPHMQTLVLHEGVLRLARNLWNDLRALHDDSEPGEDNRQFRHAAYRQYVSWQYGTLGARNRVVIPSCVVWRMREKYPDPNGIYTGFIPRPL